MTSGNERTSPVGKAFRWLFTDRTTGKIVVAQLPNWPLWVFIAATVVDWVAHPGGTVGTIVTIVAYAALTIWALDEIVRGVNPWRRFLGIAALVAEIVMLLRR